MSTDLLACRDLMPMSAGEKPPLRAALYAVAESALRGSPPGMRDAMWLIARADVQLPAALSSATQARYL